MPSVDRLLYERQAWSRNGIISLGGVDEAGRGPLAGPVVAAVVVMPRGEAEYGLDGAFSFLTDSKALRAEQREELDGRLRSAAGVQIGTGICSAVEVDSLNILRATHEAMRRAVLALPSLPDHVLVDGRPVPGLPVPSTAIVKGDQLSLLVAAASVIAKVLRDRLMLELDRAYPVYGFAQHKGYGTALHVQALLAHGPVEGVHRRSFRPVREAAELRERMAGRRPEGMLW